jgi:hypothetical protein
MAISQTVAALIQTDDFGYAISSRALLGSHGLSVTVIAQRAMCV